jgi:hypothetical protein
MTLKPNNLPEYDEALSQPRPVFVPEVAPPMLIAMQAPQSSYFLEGVSVS